MRRSRGGIFAQPKGTAHQQYPDFPCIFSALSVPLSVRKARLVKFFRMQMIAAAAPHLLSGEVLIFGILDRRIASFWFHG